MDQQIITFEEMFPYMSENGIFICEDTHTSYWDICGGGYKKENTFIEYAKNLVDDLHAYHSKNRDELKPTYYTKNVEFVHFYDSMVVIKKRKRSVPFSKKTGEIDWKKKVVLSEGAKLLKIAAKKLKQFEDRLAKISLPKVQYQNYSSCSLVDNSPQNPFSKGSLMK